MLPRLSFTQLPGQYNKPVVQYYNSSNSNSNQGMQFNNRNTRVGLNLSMINRVANSRPGCGSCGK